MGLKNFALNWVTVLEAHLIKDAGRMEVTVQSLNVAECMGLKHLNAWGGPLGSRIGLLGDILVSVQKVAWEGRLQGRLEAV